jgi:hypothetical protein
MGWVAYNKDGTILSEGAHDGRPVKEGVAGQLKIIEQQDYGHNVAVDLVNGIIAIDYESLDVQGGNPAIINPKLFLWVCDETTIVSDIAKIKKTKPNKEGWFDYKHERFEWRPIWFSRVFADGGGATTTLKVIGLQTTLGAPYKKRNVKKIVTLYPDGRIGID